MVGKSPLMRRGGRLVKIETESGISLRELLGAAIKGEMVEAQNEETRDLMVVHFDGKPSWEHANVIAAFRLNAQDLLHRSVRIAGGGKGSVIVKFDLGSPLEPQERELLKKRIQHLIQTDFIKERYGIKTVAFKAASERAQEKEFVQAEG